MDTVLAILQLVSVVVLVVVFAKWTIEMRRETRWIDRENKAIRRETELLLRETQLMKQIAKGGR